MTNGAIEKRESESATATKRRGRRWACALGVSSAIAAAGCGANGGPNGTAGSGPSGGADEPTVLHAVIGRSGGELVGERGTPLEGVRLTVPPNALAGDTELTISRTEGAQPLPKSVVACGPKFSIEPAGLQLAKPATLVMPVDGNEVTQQNRLADEVDVLAAAPSGWMQHPQTASTDGSVTVTVDALTVVAPCVTPPPEKDVVRFDLRPNPKFAPCFAKHPNDPNRAPSVTVTVVRGELNDRLFLQGKNFKPDLQFDLFTVENSSLDSNGKPDPAFKNFGLAWYQSDLDADDHGSMRVSIRTCSTKSSGSTQR
jgi:hypothetical protein